MDAKKQIEDNEINLNDLISEDFSISHDFKNYDGFTTSIPNKQINELLTDKPYLLIRDQIKCICCDNINHLDIKYKYILIQHNNLTRYNVINELIKKKYKKKCTHKFLEGFIKLTNNEYEIIWGS